MRIKLIRYEEGTGSGVLHLRAIPCQDTETLCGIFMGGGIPEDIQDEKPTCPYCIEIAQTLFRRYQKKVVRTWDEK